MSSTIRVSSKKAASHLNRLHDAAETLNLKSHGLINQGWETITHLEKGTRPSSHNQRLTDYIEALRAYETLVDIWHLVDGVTAEDVKAAAGLDRVWFTGPDEN